MDDVAFDHQVFVDEIRRIAVVGVDAPHLCRRKDHDIRLFRLHEIPDCRLRRQVQFGMRAGQKGDVFTRCLARR